MIQKTNEAIVEGRKFRRLIDKETGNWIVTNPALLSEKYRLNAMFKFQPINPSKVRFRGKSSMEELFVFTDKYDNFIYLVSPIHKG